MPTEIPSRVHSVAKSAGTVSLQDVLASLPEFDGNCAAKVVLPNGSFYINTDAHNVSVVYGSCL